MDGKTLVLESAEAVFGPQLGLCSCVTLGQLLSVSELLFPLR